MDAPRVLLGVDLRTTKMICLLKRLHHMLNMCSIWCHMVCYVTMVTFVATCLVNKFTSIIMDN